MRVIGFCIKCRKVKYVTVRHFTSKGVQMGVCLDCEKR